MPEDIILTLDDNEEVLDALEKYAKENSLDYGAFISARGKIKEFEILSGGQHSRMDRMKVKEDAIVDSISGKIQKMGGNNIYIAMNVSVTKGNFTSLSGQFLKGKASGSLELKIRKSNVKKMIEA